MNPSLVSADEWRQLEPLLDAALALPAERRHAYLHVACGEDEGMRDKLEQLIRHADTPDPFLDAPAAERFAALLATPSSAADVLSEALTEALADRYRIVRELGRGGMATVYLAHDIRHDREVAIKMLRHSVGTLLGADRFHTEIRLTAGLRHPHVLPLFDSGEADGRLYYVMPFIDGGSLRDLLDGKGPSRADEPRRRRVLAPQALRIMAQVTSALADAHAHGVVHRDLKPENILLTPSGEHAYLADFGIALAASPDPMGRVTRPGFVLGTPAYMSPEQLRGETDLDGRSDVFSLGRVLYEMLTGVLPPDGGLPPDSPLWDTPVAALVTRAMAPARDQRFQSANEFLRAIEDTARTIASMPATLEMPMHTGAGPISGAHLSSSIGALSGAHSGATSTGARFWRRLGIATGLAAAAVIAVSTSWLSTRDASSAEDALWDADAVAVLPFRLDAGDGAPLLSGDNSARLLYDALSRWENLRLSDEMRVADALRDRRAVDTLSVNGARAVARRIGAGSFIWGAVSSNNGVLRVRAHLYEAGRGEPATHVVHMAAGTDVAAAFAELADSLVSRLARTPGTASPMVGTRNFEALKRYADGHAALKQWDTRAAETQFRAAIALDSGFAPASLALAQSMSWSGNARPAAWRAPALRAVTDSLRLSVRERALARALLALAESRMADACEEYRTLSSRTPGDFAARFGLGECLSYDRTVVRDASDTTRWRFRANRMEAIAAYSQALELVPSYFEAARGATFAALSRRVLYTGETDYRPGVALAPDTVRMGAFPELVGDSVVYRPVPIRELFRTPAPVTHKAAVARNREALRALTTRWTNVHPRSVAAWLRHAEALESLGMLESAGPGTVGALPAVRTARRLAASDTTIPADLRTTAAATEVRLLLRLRRFEDARLAARAALADTIRYARRAVDGDSSEAVNGLPTLAALAALTGRAQLAARLLETAAARSPSSLWLVPSGKDLSPPLPVLRAAGAFMAYASLGAPMDSVRATRNRVEREINAWVPRDADERDRARAIMLARGSLQAQPALGLAALDGLNEAEAYDDHLALWQRFARGDTTGMHAALSAPVMSPVVNVARAPEWLLQRAHLALAVYDTAVAVTALDEVMTSLPTQLDRLTREPSPAAALGRALLLRAQLYGARANQPGARAAATSAGRAVAALWADGDAEFRMQSASAARIR
ncbi:MAG TPA: serine/threonine-protein kinase [Gemmatimonas sp.]|uniref:serine/threonine-protein kinase n=1 Tax=Gemmatimonas sp. TaxID=1962908 RepID=UPI002EDAB126